MEQSTGPSARDPVRRTPDDLDRNQLDRERRRQIRGLLLLATSAIVFAIFRAGLHRVFTLGWWRLW